MSAHELVDVPPDIDQIATRIAGQYLDAPISCAGLYRSVADALMAERASSQEEIARLRKALEPFSKKDRWFKTYHRPEVPGPELPVVFFSDNPWESNDLEPWVAAARALASKAGAA